MPFFLVVFHVTGDPFRFHVGELAHPAPLLPLDGGQTKNRHIARRKGQVSLPLSLSPLVSLLGHY
tara:strand:- start:522 stop:716 length:195 start_codon:yes stop_codon:yes gene_type:complete